MTTYLADTSALSRLLGSDRLADRWDTDLQAGRVAVCQVVELEMLFSARSARDRREKLGLLETVYRWVPMPERVFEQATAVQAALTDLGAHRSASPVDLLVAATAESHRLTLLHYDHDFEQIARVTGQPLEWLTEPGSID